MKPNLSDLSLVAALLAALAQPALTQEREPSHRQTNGPPQQAGGFGEILTEIGDFDGDGYLDYAVTAKNYQIGGLSLGRVYVYSGRSGALLTTFDGSEHAASFGLGVADVGDVTGDGVRDFVIGSPLHALSNGTSSAGRVVGLSGADGSMIWDREGDTLLGRLGDHVLAIGSTAGGAVAVGVVETGFDSTTLNNCGRVLYLDPGTGTILGWVEGDLANKKLGTTVAGYPESGVVYAGTNDGLVYDATFTAGMTVAVNVLGAGPGSADTVQLALLQGATPGSLTFAAGYRSADTSGFVNNGVIEIYAMGGGTPLLTIDGPHSIASAGRLLAHGRDIDGDGVDELIYLHDATSFTLPATIKVVNQAGVELDSFSFSGLNSGMLASIPDVTGDGRGEVLASVNNGNALLFEARLYSDGLQEGTPTSTLGGFTRGFDIDAGVAHAGDIYGQLYSLSGASPGVVAAPGAPLAPLNVDGNTITIMGLAGTVLFPDAFGFLDGAGRANTTMTLNGNLTNLLSGSEFTTCVVVIPLSGTDVVFASNPDVFMVP